MYLKLSSRGFTLIELLVVIAIIGILASVVLASLNSARANARDAVRLSDMQQISKAMELYFLDIGRYPGETWCDSSRGSVAAACSAATGDNWSVTSGIYAALVPNYIPILPVDPLNSATFFYVYEPESSDDYCISAALERGGRFRITNGPGAPNC